MRSWAARILFQDGQTAALTARAKDEATRALSLRRASTPNYSPNRGLDVSGYKLAIISQNHAYKILCSMRSVGDRHGTTVNVGRVRAAVGEATGHWPSEKEVWETTRMAEINRPAREFIWRSLHNMQSVGNYWRNIRNREMLGDCPQCESLESMDHILFECNAPGQDIVWSEVKQLWARTGLGWPGVNFGTAVGCGLMVIKGQDGAPLPGASRLFRILISEAIFLIWKIRNERRIQNKDDPELHAAGDEIVRRWRATIERKFRLELNLTSRKRYKGRALKWKSVLLTWGPIIHKQANEPTPDKWWAGPEVLVSIWPPRPRGRER
ncbi:hypothetical protein AURDEDRAFT_73872 [Auricularia subglabra TFB-10046 SS5]|nr:hypothetical protein AURDEDRAFT_73872 [Auricularia subglabra TFB-10046 SS5]